MSVNFDGYTPAFTQSLFQNPNERVPGRVFPFTSPVQGSPSGLIGSSGEDRERAISELTRKILKERHEYHRVPSAQERTETSLKIQAGEWKPPVEPTRRSPGEPIRTPIGSSHTQWQVDMVASAKDNLMSARSELPVLARQVSAHDSPALARDLEHAAMFSSDRNGLEDSLQGICDKYGVDTQSELGETTRKLFVARRDLEREPQLLSRAMALDCAREEAERRIHERDQANRMQMLAMRRGFQHSTAGCCIS